jgi:SAM-dependent methyltransferase
VIDGGELPGTPSTVIDLRRFESGGVDAVSIVRQGAVTEDEVAAALAGQFHFNPDTYVEMIRADVPEFDSFEDTIVECSGTGASSILDLGTGTGETARRLLARHPHAHLVGIDENGSMLTAARAALPADRVTLRVARLQDPLPAGSFDLVASGLCVHHLAAVEKADLFRRIRAVLPAGGRFVFGDVVVPVDPADATSSLTPGYDKPDTVADQLVWLTEAGFEAGVAWESGDLAVLVAVAV